MNRILLLTLLALPLAAQPIAEPVPLPRAYSHNDYKQARPLRDALDRGFCAVEADVYWMDGELRVAHKKRETEPGVTLQRLYLDPLLERVRKNGGTVYPKGPGFTLLIDVISDGRETYPILRETLKRYAEMLTIFRGDVVEPGAVTVVISGNKDKDAMSREALRYAGVDGRPEDLDSREKTLFPLISAEWKKFFDWRGGPMDPKESARLQEMTRKAHARGSKIRFYAIPDNEEGWTLMLKSGVDFINTDKVDGLKNFLAGRRPPPTDLPSAPSTSP